MLLVLTLLFVGWPQEAAAPVSANVWQGQVSAYEEALRTAAVVKVVDLSIGVTHPQRAYAPPGGLIESFAWKTIAPNRYGGYWESYKSEIAAYELDKMLGLQMIPVVVERKVQGAKGAAILWLKGVRSWDEVTPLPKPASWARQVVRMKMFDELIGNIDRNKGNMLIDAAWNLYLIDHTRAFVGERQLPGTPLQHVDPDLWKAMLALDPVELKAKLGPWIDGGSIKAMLDRRDRMKAMIEALVKKEGESVWLR